MKLVTIRVKYSTAQNKWHVSGAGFVRDIVDAVTDYLDNSVKDSAIRYAYNFVYRNGLVRGRQTLNPVLEKVVEHSDHYMVTFKTVAGELK
jgi:hypothetical protein